jgi:hypothetical protein
LQLGTEDYLPADALAWCEHKFQELGFTETPKQADFIRDRTLFLPDYFMVMLTAARSYSVDWPDHLSTIKKPRGGYRWNFIAAVLEAWAQEEDTAGELEGAYRFDSSASERGESP